MDDDVDFNWNDFEFVDSGYEVDSGEDIEQENDDDNHSEGRDDFYPSDADILEETVWDSEEYFSSENSDSEGYGNKAKLRSKEFREVDTFHPRFEIGQRFFDKKLLREAIKSHAAKTKRNLKIKKNDKIRMHIKCCGNEKRKKVKPCTWLIHALKVPEEETFRIAQYISTHTCINTSKVRMVDSTFIANKYLDLFTDQPSMDLKGFRMMVKRQMGFNMSRQQSIRARKTAFTKLHGDPAEQYNSLWDFVDEVKRANPGSTCLLGLDPNGEGKFDRMYICLDAVKKGFKAGCRPIIGVDDCHLKGPYGGVLLNAVGVDPNNNLFPIAWAVVLKECNETWEWFLHILSVDLGLEERSKWTFMSDKQKGLLNAFQTMFEGSEIRHCLRHMHTNFKSGGFRGDAFKHALWNCGKALTVPQFERRMEEMGKVDPKALEWLSNKPAKHWSRSHFRTYPQCDILLNNMCESYNKMILDARSLPILSMWISLFGISMKRLQKNRDTCSEKWKGLICPKIMKILQKNIDNTRGLIAIKSDDYHYMVEVTPQEFYSVDLHEMKCGCRAWDLSGIPCTHVVAAIAEQGWDPVEFVSNCYHVATYKKVYGEVIIPSNGKSEWTKAQFTPPLPPNEGRTTGRPGTQRRKEIDEPRQNRKRKPRGKQVQISISNPKKLKRQQDTCRCSHCGVQGHNIMGCQLKKQEILRSGITNEDMNIQVNFPTSSASKLQVYRKGTKANASKIAPKD
ncbi:hypothetical protein OROMI_019274 [Orobanche minor]